jgi:hypothetical protein
MKIIIATGEHVLAKILCHALPWCWYEKHDHALMRDDGLIYIGGFKTREKAEAWALKNNIIKKLTQ